MNIAILHLGSLNSTMFCDLRLLVDAIRTNGWATNIITFDERPEIHHWIHGTTAWNETGSKPRRVKTGAIMTKTSVIAHVLPQSLRGESLTPKKKLDKITRLISHIGEEEWVNGFLTAYSVVGSIICARLEAPFFVMTNTFDLDRIASGDELAERVMLAWSQAALIVFPSEEQRERTRTLMHRFIGPASFHNHTLVIDPSDEHGLVRLIAGPVNHTLRSASAAAS